MKENYLRPAIINADILESTYGIIPFAAVGAAVAAAASSAASAAAAVASSDAFAAGVAAALGVAAVSSKKSSRAFPTRRLPSFMAFSSKD